MNAYRENEYSMAKRAAEWLRALESADPEQRAAFSEWLRQSPQHVRELLLMTALDKALEDIDPDSHIDIDTLIAGAPANVVPLSSIGRESRARATTHETNPGLDERAALFKHHDGEESRRSRIMRYMPSRWVAGIAAVSIALVLAHTWVPDGVFNTPSYRTAIGEQRAFELDDGSIVYLNAHSQITVHFSPHARDLQLLEGEALFKVRHDPARPFRVLTDDAVIQAVGTEFNVYRRKAETKVSVLEGRVQVLPETVGNQPNDRAKPAEPRRGPNQFEKESPARRPTARAGTPLGAGEEATVARGGAVLKVAAADVASALAWRQRRLVFRSDTLADIAAEFNRYNRAPQIRIQSPSLRTRRFNGVFNADDPDTLLQYLAHEPEVTFERRGDDIVIREK